MISLKALLLLSILPATWCAAQTTEKEDPIQVAYEGCMSKDTTSSNMSNCAYIAYGKWQSELDKYYDRVTKQLRNSKDKLTFKQAQNAWIAYRAAEFAAYDHIFNMPGAKWYAIRLNSRINVIRQRVGQLRDYYEILDEKKGRTESKK